GLKRDSADIQKSDVPDINMLKFSSSAANEKANKTGRKFIRTAELKFKVKDVVKATYAIEDIAVNAGGFVTNTNLTSEINNTTVTAISADSSLETDYYSVINNMTLRVPNAKLDSTLRAVAVWVDYLDFRIIKADDVGLQLLQNQLAQNRTGKHQERLTKAIDKRGKKLDETVNAEENLLNKQQQLDEAKISNLSLNDQINYSTVNIAMYQRQTIKRELIGNNKNIDAYEPGFGAKLLESLKFGGHILAEFILFLAKLWGMFLFAAAACLLYRFLRKRFSK
ncbi:MAG: DUF4349 domain-containing protein, partial [Sphingobacteriales bacterium]